MFVVTLPPSAEKHPRAFAAKAKSAGADMLEIRSDLTPRVRSFDSPLPLLLAIRGTSDLGLIERLEPEYLDRETHDARARVRKFILSFHDYEKTPSLKTLKKIVQKMYSSKPWMIKIATMIRSYDDILVLQDLQSFMNKKSIRSTVLGMGPKAHLTRVLSPYNNALTYASLDPRSASADGQLPLSFYRLTKNRKHPRLFGIIGGSQISASLSPVIHNTLFQRHAIDALYSCFPTEDFASTMKSLEELGVQGLSVTAPFKRQACDYAEVHDPISQKLGVANTLVKKRGVWHAYNTDVFGVLDGYPELRRAKKVAILGAGGAVPAVIEAIRMASSRAEVTVFSRDSVKAKRELSASNVEVRPITEGGNAVVDVVICAVSQDVVLALPKPRTKASLAIDLRYGTVTKFMKAAKQKKFRVKDGMPMLKKQAVSQSKLFSTANHRK